MKLFLEVPREGYVALVDNQGRAINVSREFLVDLPGQALQALAEAPRPAGHRLHVEREDGR